MAQDNRVELEDPNGNKFLASTPAEVSNLVYGMGYKVKSHKTVEEATAALAEKGPVAEALAQAQAPPSMEAPSGGKGSK